VTDTAIVITFPEWLWPVVSLSCLALMAASYAFLCWFCRRYERRHGGKK
jgi:hypothetical protein